MLISYYKKKTISFKKISLLSSLSFPCVLIYLHSIFKIATFCSYIHIENNEYSHVIRVGRSVR
jgi:hypothetical protein